MIVSAKLPLGLRKRTLSAPQLKRSNNRLGYRGESRALAFLQHKQYRILGRNVAHGRHEIDLVALDVRHDELVFVEVKTRMSAGYGHPSSAVGYLKLRAMQEAARAYIKHSHLDKSYRFDIISVLPDRVEHFENVTW